MTYAVEQRAAIIERVVEGLSKGTPLAVICREDGMPCDDTVRSWADGDAGLSRAIARAREAGHDTIAQDCLAIADNIDEDPASRRVRVDTRMKLLAKWDPKRYGDKTLVGSDPENPLPAGFTVNLVRANVER